MRNRHIVTYDISDPARLRLVHRKMNGFGDALQYSVFSCDLSEKERILMEEALASIINAREDRILIIDLGPAAGRGNNSVRTLGRQSPPAEPKVMVI